MKIVFLDAKTMGEVPNLSELEKLGDYTSYQLTSPQERKERAAGAEILITCKVVIDKEIIDANPALKLICVAATGMNNVDVDYARSKGIEVKNVTGYSTESVAQLTVAMALSLSNRLSYYDKFVKSGDYSQNSMFTHYGPSFSELNGKTAGIIGLGNIGKRVAALLEAFGMRIVYHSVSGNNMDSRYTRLELNELLSGSDLICIHCPLTDKTRNLIRRDNILLMKSSAILVNMARGGIVNETDIAEAVENGTIGGFATDVFVTEPMDPQSPLLNIKHSDKLILTPHIAWTSVEARTLLIKKLEENISSFLNQQ